MRIVMQRVLRFIEHRNGSGHDVDAVLSRQIAEKLDLARDALGQIDDLLADRPAYVAEGKQPHREVFQKDDQMTLLVDRRVHSALT